jgi:hypothetical protein
MADLLAQKYSRNLTGSVHYTWGKELSTEGGDNGEYYGSDQNTSDIQDFFNMKAARVLSRRCYSLLYLRSGICPPAPG